MGCPCENQNPAPEVLVTAAQQNETGCPYSEVQLREWRRLLSCAQNSPQAAGFGISAPQAAQALTLVNSALDVVYNPCFYQAELSVHTGLIFQIISAGICP